jgi:hypothetical protein
MAAGGVVTGVGEGTGDAVEGVGTVAGVPLTVARDTGETGEDDSRAGRGSISGLFVLGLFFSNSSISRCNSRCASP